MTITAMSGYITGNFERSYITEADGDFFFFYGEDNKFPFATIVTKDGDFDNSSKLDREGFYRLNVGIDKETFNTLFGTVPATKGFGGYLESGIDFTQEKTLMPHPIYGTMYWVCMINPGVETIASLQPLLRIAYDRAVEREKRRSGDETA